jgi:hypothetical protein
VKDETLYCRMTPAMKRQLDQEAERRGESASYVVREALREYFTRREMLPACGTPNAIKNPGPSAPAPSPEAAA